MGNETVKARQLMAGGTAEAKPIMDSDQAGIRGDCSRKHPGPDWVTGAKSRVVLQGTGDWLMALLPDDPENTILKRFKKNKPDDDQADSEQQPSGGSDGYSKPARDSLKKLIEKPAAR